jgi:hypothetical protein
MPYAERFDGRTWFRIGCGIMSGRSAVWECRKALPRNVACRVLSDDGRTVCRFVNVGTVRRPAGPVQDLPTRRTKPARPPVPRDVRPAAPDGGRNPAARFAGRCQVLTFDGGWATANAHRVTVRVIYIHDSKRNRDNLAHWCGRLHLAFKVVQTDRRPGESQPSGPDARNAAYDVSGLPDDLSELCGKPFVRQWHHAVAAGPPRMQRPNMFMRPAAGRPAYARAEQQWLDATAAARAFLDSQDTSRAAEYARETRDLYRAGRKLRHCGGRLPV